MSTGTDARWGFSASTGLAFTRADIVDAHFEACRPTYLELLRAVGLRPGWRVLDAGCGTGRFLPHLAELVGVRGSLAAVDLTPENAGLAAAVAADLPLPVEVRQGDLLDLPHPDDSFDAAWCANTAQYLDDAALTGALAELRRVVRPGGLVAVKELDGTTVTARPGPQFLFSDLFRAAAPTSPYARNLLRSRDLYRHLAAAGLVDVRQRTLLSEHHAPLSPVERAFYGQACARLAAQAAELGLDVEEWAGYSAGAEAGNPLDAPDAYICEGNVLAVGVVP
ncbi:MULTISPECIES: class I SAM-dependent methyltransferase [Actinosynnema]|uniref:class I SAM-dependent methyltransferase n=1 Tax=Actinosynnema TaxID=40566 RepID=UPI0020A4F4A0|nr:class I SAM-dependent methyltransferase [Actinosynnema pretiosum]MCP2094777.1 Ubiquinone/menaquinone biosynthesis C-methylase UbiE [Actinosynnema pretiosum]